VPASAEVRQQQQDQQQQQHGLGLEVSWLAASKLFAAVGQTSIMQAACTCSCMQASPLAGHQQQQQLAAVIADPASIMVGAVVHENVSMLWVYYLQHGTCILSAQQREAVLSKAGWRHCMLALSRMNCHLSARLCLIKQQHKQHRQCSDATAVPKVAQCSLLCPAHHLCQIPFTPCNLGPSYRVCQSGMSNQPHHPLMPCCQTFAPFLVCAPPGLYTG